MEVQYACTLADYVEVLTTARSRTLKRKIFSAVITMSLLTLGAAVMVSLGFRQSVAFPIMVVLLAGFWLIRRQVLYPSWVRKDFASHPNFSRERTLRIDESGLNWSSEVDRSETKWQAFSRFQETENLFVLYLGERLAEAVPKRALAGAQLDEFRQLLFKKLPQRPNSSNPRSANVSLV
jgi:YcxB-like protein